jgi:thiamine-phosphate pyrophosphorylase
MHLLDALRLVFVVGLPTARDGDRLDAALGGGVTALWLRAREVDGATLHRLARSLQPRCEAHGAALLVGDRADVALAAGADGVHLGLRSPPADRVRPWFPRWMGVSCHGAEELERAAAAGADYAILSPVFGVPEKGPPLGIPRFQALRRSFPGPVVALGGIDASSAADLRAAGADGVAVVRALQDAPDPAGEARRIRRALDARRQDPR